MHLETYDSCITEKPLQLLQLLVCMKTLSKTLVLQLTTVKDVIQRQLILWHQFFPLSYYSYLLPYSKCTWVLSRCHAIVV